MATAETGDIELKEPAEHIPKPERHSSDQSTFVDEEKNMPSERDSTQLVANGTADKEEETDPNQQEIRAGEVEMPQPVNPVLQPPASTIPNGGFTAWLQVAGSFCLYFNTWGLINSFGAFQTYYMNDMLKHEDPSNIAWIGSTQSFLVLLIGTVTGPIFDAGHFFLLIRLGAFCLVLGLFMTSLCHELWQLILAQGILTGLGAGMIFMPAFAIIPQYFSTKKSLAVGLASVGSSIGGILYPIIFHRLQPTIGFPWATRVLAFVSLATVSVSCVVMKPRVRPQGRRKLIQLHAYRELPFVLNQVAGFLSFVGFFAPFFYISSYSLSKPEDNHEIAFYLLSIILTGSFFGRILPNLIADKTGPFFILIPASIVSGALALFWIAIDSTPGLIAFAILFGFFTGGLVSLTPLTVVVITKDMRDLGTRFGMFSAVGSIAVLIGAPTLGAILNDTGSYLGVKLFTGICLIAGGLIWIPVYFMARKMKHGLNPTYGPGPSPAAPGPSQSATTETKEDGK